MLLSISGSNECEKCFEGRTSQNAKTVCLDQCIAGGNVLECYVCSSYGGANKFLCYLKCEPVREPQLCSDRVLAQMLAYLQKSGK